MTRTNREVYQVFLRILLWVPNYKEYSGEGGARVSVQSNARSRAQRVLHVWWKELARLVRFALYGGGGASFLAKRAQYGEGRLFWGERMEEAAACSSRSGQKGGRERLLFWVEQTQRGP